MIPRVSVCGFWGASLDGLHATSPGKVFCRDFLVAMHKTYERLFGLILEDDGFYGRVVIQTQFGCALYGSTMQRKIIRHQLEFCLGGTQCAYRHRHRYLIWFHSGGIISKQWLLVVDVSYGDIKFLVWSVMAQVSSCHLAQNLL